jgi:hypothetical protein
MLEFGWCGEVVLGYEGKRIWIIGMDDARLQMDSICVEEERIKKHESLRKREGWLNAELRRKTCR